MPHRAAPTTEAINLSVATTVTSSISLLLHNSIAALHAINDRLWVDTQRKEKRKFDMDPATSQLTAEWAGKLEALGFVWDPYASAWEESLVELVAAFTLRPC